MGKTHVRPGVVLEPYLRPGRCRWCRCTDRAACPQGCGWVDRAQTLCTACRGVDAAWAKLEAARLPNMHRAFFRGFMTGSADPDRAIDWGRTPRSNPYASRQGARYWAVGYVAGAQALHRRIMPPRPKKARGTR